MFRMESTAYKWYRYCGRAFVGIWVSGECIRTADVSSAIAVTELSQRMRTKPTVSKDLNSELNPNNNRREYP